MHPAINPMHQAINPDPECCCNVNNLLPNNLDDEGMMMQCLEQSASQSCTMTNKTISDHKTDSSLIAFSQ
jgi:hypothetical protein